MDINNDTFKKKKTKIFIIFFAFRIKHERRSFIIETNV